MKQTKRIHVGNVIAVIALFIALSGTAVAGVQLARNSVDSGKIRNETIRGLDIKDGKLTGLDVQDASLSGADLATDSVRGDQVDESSLGDVASATQGGTGRYGFNGSCDPNGSQQYVPCSVVNVTLDRPGRVLVTAMVEASNQNGPNGNVGLGDCRIGTTNGPITASTSPVYAPLTGFQYVPVTAVTDVFPAGTHSFGIDCHEDTPGYPVKFPLARVTAVALSAK